MPETSIVVKSTDRYSDAIKKMSSVTKSFSKDVDKLEDTLYALNKNKITMKMDLSKAKSELKAAEKQFDLTHSAADGLKLELAQANYDNMVRNLKAVTSAASLRRGVYLQRCRQLHDFFHRRQGRLHGAEHRKEADRHQAELKQCRDHVPRWQCSGL